MSAENPVERGDIVELAYFDEVLVGRVTRFFSAADGIKAVVKVEGHREMMRSPAALKIIERASAPVESRAQLLADAADYEHDGWTRS